MSTKAAASAAYNTNTVVKSEARADTMTEKRSTIEYVADTKCVSLSKSEGTCEHSDKVWLYPGSFDPFTLGHLHIVEQAAAQVDELVIVILTNHDKGGLLPLDLRLRLIQAAVDGASLRNVKVRAYSGLLIDAYRDFQAAAVIRGIRNYRDFEYERDYSLANKEFLPDCNFIYFMAAPALTHVSSSLVRELLKFGRSPAELMPQSASLLLQTYWEQQSGKKLEKML